MIRASVSLLFAAAAFAADCPADGPRWTVPVRVLGGSAAPDFALTVDGKARAICEVAHPRMPVSVGIVLDVSKSMRAGQLDRRALALAVATSLLDRSGPQDEILLVYAGSRAAVAVPFTRDLTRVRSGLNIPARGGGTAVIDGMCEAVKAMSAAHHATRVVVVFSDGDDNNSSCSIGELQSAARANLCPLFLLAPAIPAEVHLSEMPDVAKERIAPALRETGGHAAFVSNEKDMEAAVASLAEAIRAPYLLRFAGPSGKVKVEARGKPRPTLLYRPEAESSR